MTTRENSNKNYDGCDEMAKGNVHMCENHFREHPLGWGFERMKAKKAAARATEKQGSERRREKSRNKKHKCYYTFNTCESSVE